MTKINDREYTICNHADQLHLGDWLESSDCRIAGIVAITTDGDVHDAWESLDAEQYEGEYPSHGKSKMDGYGWIRQRCSLVATAAEIESWQDDDPRHTGHYVIEWDEVARGGSECPLAIAEKLAR